MLPKQCLSKVNTALSFFKTKICYKKIRRHIYHVQFSQFKKVSKLTFTIATSDWTKLVCLGKEQKLKVDKIHIKESQIRRETKFLKSEVWGLGEKYLKAQTIQNYDYINTLDKDLDSLLLILNINIHSQEKNLKYPRYIQSPVKHLRWGFCVKCNWLKACSNPSKYTKEYNLGFHYWRNNHSLNWISLNTEAVVRRCSSK